MAEQTQNSDDGSVGLPLAVGVAGGVATKMLYSKSSKQLLNDAVNGVEGVKGELKAAAENTLKANGKQLLRTHQSAKVLSNPADIESIKKITITEAIGKDAKGFDVQFHNGKRRYAQLHVDNLSGEAAALFKDGKKTVTGEDLLKLTSGGEKSWVAKTAASSEKEVLTAVRKSKAWAEAGGGIKATLSHAGGGSKLMIATAVVAAIGGIGMGIKNMFSSPSTHAGRVEAERTNAQAGKEATVGV